MPLRIRQIHRNGLFSGVVRVVESSYAYRPANLNRPFKQ
jgi:hypothetical protein